MLCCAVLYCTVLYFTVLCCTLLRLLFLDTSNPNGLNHDYSLCHNRGNLRAVDEVSGEEIEVSALADTPVYLKYGPQLTGDAYMKAYAGSNIGVIFQPRLKGQTEEEFYQFGDLPLSLFVL